MVYRVIDRLCFPWLPAIKELLIASVEIEVEIEVNNNKVERYYLLCLAAKYVANNERGFKHFTTGIIFTV